jgi:hypothetical protein
MFASLLLLLLVCFDRRAVIVLQKAAAGKRAGSGGSSSSKLRALESERNSLQQLMRSTVAAKDAEIQSLTRMIDNLRRDAGGK